MPERAQDRSFKGIEKAAIMMLSLPNELTLQLFGMLDADEIRELSMIMVNLGSVKSMYVDATMVDFVNEMSSTGSLIGSIDSTERLLVAALSQEKADLIMEEIRGPAGRTLWDKLNNVSEDLLASFLKNEYPQTVAVVLTRIKPLNASRILTILPESFAIEVVQRMLNMETVRKEIMTTVEDTLRHEFMSNLARGAKRDTHELVAEIFNNFDRANESRFMRSLEEKNIEAAERIRTLMFTFDDLARLDNAGIQTLLRNVDKAKLVLALKGSSEHIKELFLSNMSERASKLMEDDIKQLGMVRLRDVEEAQSIIVLAAKDLASQNLIFIASGNDDGDQLIG
ncbi:MAG: flagellar motor switch protein FliG [Pseudomonadota bacterium]